MGNDEFGLGINGHEQVLRTAKRVVRGDVGAVFAAHKTEHFVRLDGFRLHVSDIGV